MMTRKDYQLIAEILAHFHREYPVGSTRETVREMAVMFRRRLAFVNKNFNQGRFMAAALDKPPTKRKRVRRATPASRALANVLEHGFDRSEIERGGVRVRCSQCQAVAVNGIPTHERGCPNARRAERDAEDYDGDDE